MKSIFVSMMAVLLGFAFAIAPPPAKASGPIDCTSGCEIVTCDATYCTVWHCDSGGCLVVGGYARTQPHTQLAPSSKDHPQAFDSVCDVSRKQACAIKTCAGGECSISVFDGKGFVPVGHVKDVDQMIENANKAIRK
jgi:hypothetical protein